MRAAVVKPFIVVAIFLMLASILAPALVTAQETVAPVPAAAAAAPAPKIDTGDTAWMTIATALVMLMSIPGLALFYGGLAKRKDSLNTMAMTFVTFCIVSVLWIIYGYSFSFVGDVRGLIGSASR
ncbi:MAG TPA: ammonia channel protein, partial [Nitrospirota bacterium]